VGEADGGGGMVLGERGKGGGGWKEWLGVDQKLRLCIWTLFRGLDMGVFVGDTTVLCHDLRRWDDNRKTNMMVSSIS
jgi:hypothetical protein